MRRFVLHSRSEAVNSRCETNDKIIATGVMLLTENLLLWGCTGSRRAPGTLVQQLTEVFEQIARHLLVAQVLVAAETLNDQVLDTHTLHTIITLLFCVDKFGE